MANDLNAAERNLMRFGERLSSVLQSYRDVDISNKSFTVYPEIPLVNACPVKTPLSH